MYTYKNNNGLPATRKNDACYRNRPITCRELSQKSLSGDDELGNIMKGIPTILVR